MVKKTISILLLLLFASIVLPAILTKTMGRFNESAYLYNPSTNHLEEYVVGVVAAEMPALFHNEALKAQAVAARTYAINQKKINPLISYYELEQAYLSEEERKALWGENFNVYEQKIRTAVYATKGEIMTYDNEPILAVFHAMSGGYTENVEYVWQTPLPYLVSVESYSDQINPHFVEQKSFKNAEVVARLGGTQTDEFAIISRSEAGYVLQVSYGALLFSGADIRMLFGLRSTNFTIAKENGGVIFTTKGYGHGVGMSQEGANDMATDGKLYHDILLHYYKDIQFSYYFP